MRGPASALLVLGGGALLSAQAFAASGAPSPKATAEAAKADKAAAPNPDGSPASPQQRVLYEVKDANGIFKFDYGAPTSPAMTLLGLSSDTTPPSTSLTDLVVALPTLYGSDAGQSLAVDFPAARLFESRFKSTYDSYIHATGPWYRIGYRTRLGLAALNGNDGGGDASKQVRSRLVFGLSASLLDSSDPLMVRNAKGGLLLDSCLAPLTLISQPILDKGVGQVAYDTDEVGGKLDDVRDLLDAYQRGHGAFTDEQRKAARVAIGLDKPDAGAVSAADAPVVTQPEPKADPKRAKIEALLAEAEARKADPSLVQAIRLMLDDGPATAHAAAPADAPPAKVAVDVPDMTDAQLFAALKSQEAKLTAQLDLAHTKGGTSIDDSLKEAGVTAAVQRCNASAARMARFAPDLDIGLGILAQGAPGKLKDVRADGKVFWLAYKHPIGTPVFEDEYGADSLSPLPASAWLIALAARASWDERLVTKDKTTPEFRADTLNAWIGLERLTPGYRLTAQYGWLKVRASDAIGKPFEKSGERYLVGGQFRLREDSPLWLGLTYGNGYGTVGELKANTALVTLSYSSPGPPDITK